MKTFREYLNETISDGITGNNLELILKNFKDRKEIVRFALYCAKSVEHLAKDSRVIENNKAVENWLKDGKKFDLNFVRDNAWDNVINNTNWNEYYITKATANTIRAASGNSYVVPAYGAAAANAAARAKSYNLYPNDEKKESIAFKKYFEEYTQIAQNWLRKWDNAPGELQDISATSPEIIFDYLQDNPMIMRKLIPNNGNNYYLNISGMEEEFTGESEEEVLGKVMRSTKRGTILGIIGRMMR